MASRPRLRRGALDRPARPWGEPRSKGEEGFTLIELLIVMVILPIVVGGVTIAIVTSLQDQQNLAGQLENSSGAQQASAVFVRDVQSAATITAPSATSCGMALGTQVLVLQWASTTVSYEYTSGAHPNLVRTICANGSPSNSYLALDLDPAHPPTVRVTVCPSGGSCQRKTTGTWNAGVDPIDTIELTATFSGGAPIFSLTGTPRTWSPPSGGRPVPSLLVTGSGPGTLSDTGAGDVTVNGPLIVNSSSNDSIVLGPTERGDLTTSGPNPIYVADPTPAAAVQTLGSGSVDPTPTYGAPTPDPYAGVTPPSQPAAGPGCIDNPINDTEMCSPGYYATAPALVAGDAVEFASGIYYLAQGIDLSQSGEVTDAPFQGSSGVLFYVTGGPVSFPTMDTVDISSLSSASQYRNIVIWQASLAPGDAVTLSGARRPSDYSGSVYAPKEEVDFVGTDRIAVTGPIVAHDVVFSQRRQVTIG